MEMLQLKGHILSHDDILRLKVFGFSKSEEMQMSHVFQVPDDIYTEIATYAAQRGQTPDALLIALLAGGVELLKRVEATPSLHEVSYDPAHDPLAPFIGAFDGGDEDTGWIERHYEFFAGDPGERYGNEE